MSEKVVTSEKSQGANINASWQEQLSACIDGELSSAQYAKMRKQMNASANTTEAQEIWSQWCLIKEALKQPQNLTLHSSQEFLANSKNRLNSQEQVQLEFDGDKLDSAEMKKVADVKTNAANDGAFRWKMAAGFASFAFVLAAGWGTFLQFGTSDAQQLAQTSEQKPMFFATNNSAQGLTLVSSDLQPLSINTANNTQDNALTLDKKYGAMIRDPRLDAVLLRQKNARSNTLSPSEGFLSNTNLHGFGYQPAAMAQ